MSLSTMPIDLPSNIESLLIERLGEAYTERIGDAFQFAALSHSGQSRKTDDPNRALPYIVHPVHVAVLSHALFDNSGLDDGLREHVIVAALLHDVVEDCNVSILHVRRQFGPEVGDLVARLSKPRRSTRESYGDHMKRFISQIGEGAVASAFLKACDLIDNLSLDRNTPINVLESAVRKARTYYLPLFSRCALPPALLDAVETAVHRAERESGTGSFRAGVLGPDEVFKLMQQPDPKLDLHDFPGLVSDIFSDADNGLWIIADETIIEIASHPKSFNVEAHIWPLVIDAATKRGGFSWIKSKWFKKNSSLTQNDVKYCALVDRTVYGRVYLAIACIRNDAIHYRTGLTPEFVMRGMLSLCDRETLRLWSDLALEANRLGMSLNLSQAIDAGVRRGGLEQLHGWLRICEAACKNIAFHVNAFLGNRYDKRTLWSRIRIEHRVKTPQSIFNKVSTKPKLAGDFVFEDIGDLAGVRIVCPTISHAQLIMEWVQSDARDWQVVRKPIRYDVNPTKDGYRGIHVVVQTEVAEENGSVHQVLCEIQIRTILQDAWSILSHKASYKASNKREESADRAQLVDLSQALIRCDEEIQQIFDNMDTR